MTSLSKKSPNPPSKEAFDNVQLELFKTFLANDDEQKNSLSNAIDLWDSIPRYSISRRKQDELRKIGGYLPIHKAEFHYKGIRLTAVVRPARIEKNDSAGGVVEYYPSAREELIEQALRRLATEEQSGFFDKRQPKSGLYFTLYRLRKELTDHGHSMQYKDIVEGLDVLSLSSLDIEVQENQGFTEMKKFGRSTFLSNLIGVKRQDFDKNPEARWYAEFHPFVTNSIDALTYRQFNYHRWMMAKSQISRWLISQLVLKYTQASRTQSFVMLFSTIKRDSGLVDGYKQQRQAVAAIDEAWGELKRLDVISTYTKTEKRGVRNKLEDVTYQIQASDTFSKEQRASNRRQLESKK